MPPAPTGQGRPLPGPRPPSDPGAVVLAANHLFALSVAPLEQASGYNLEIQLGARASGPIESSAPAAAARADVVFGMDNTFATA